jgi:hypothetical protein
MNKHIIEHYRIDEVGNLRRYYRNFKNFKPQVKGGKTIFRIIADEGEFVGIAECSDKDNYCYRIGRDIAFGRANKQYLESEPL